jgi:hypothetical protein
MFMEDRQEPVPLVESETLYSPMEYVSNYDAEPGPDDFVEYLMKYKQLPPNTDELIAKGLVSPRVKLFGLLRGKIEYAEGWDEPLEEMREYME